MTNNKIARILRVTEGVSQFEVSQCMGVNQQSLSFIETGRNKCSDQKLEEIKLAIECAKKIKAETI